MSLDINNFLSFIFRYYCFFSRKGEVVPLYVQFGPCQIKSGESIEALGYVSGDWVDTIPVMNTVVVQCPARPAGDYYIGSSFLW